MQNANSRKRLFVILAVAALMALFVLAGCGGDDDDMEETMTPSPMGYKVTVTNNLSESMEFFAPIVVTHASNDHLLFDASNYVTEAAEHQILTGEPDMVLEAIGEGAVAGHGSAGPPGVLLPSGESVSVMFNDDATSLRILAMVAPTLIDENEDPIYPDNYVSAVADVPMEGSVTVPLSRFDIGYDEMVDDARLMDIQLVAENAGTVTIERVGDAMADDTMMEEAPTYDIMVTNNLSDELFAPIVVTRVNDEYFLFNGADVTPQAEHQILFGGPMMVIDAIEEGNAVFFQGKLPSGESVSGMFDTDATALRIFAMVAPTMVPDNYVSAVVNIANLMMSGDSVTAPLTRFDIGHDEAVSDDPDGHRAEMPDHQAMPQMVHRHGDMETDISLVDDGMTVGTVTITRR